jgi:transposase
MRFMPVKTEEQQAALMLHKSRDLLVRQQTMLVNALRAHMAEFGLIACQGRGRARESLSRRRRSSKSNNPGSLAICLHSRSIM